MKKSLLTIIAIFGYSVFVSAQETIKDDPNEEAQERLEQEPQRQNQARIENAARMSIEQDKQNERQREANAQQLAKQKAGQEKIRGKLVKKIDPNKTKAVPKQ